MKVCLIIVLLMGVTGAAAGVAVGVFTRSTWAQITLYATIAEVIALVVGVGMCELLRRRHKRAMAYSNNDGCAQRDKDLDTHAQVSMTSHLGQTVALDMLAPTQGHDTVRSFDDEQHEPHNTSDGPNRQEDYRPEGSNDSSTAALQKAGSPSEQLNPFDTGQVYTRKAVLAQRLGQDLPVLVSIDKDNPQLGWNDLLNQIRHVPTAVTIVLCCSAGRPAASPEEGAAQEGRLAEGLAAQAGMAHVRSTVVQARGEEAKQAWGSDPATLKTALRDLSTTTDLVVIDAGRWDDPATQALRPWCDVMLVESAAPTPKKQLRAVMNSVEGKKRGTTSTLAGPVCGLVLFR